MDLINILYLLFLTAMLLEEFFFAHLGNNAFKLVHVNQIIHDPLSIKFDPSENRWLQSITPTKMRPTPN